MSKFVMTQLVGIFNRNQKRTLNERIRVMRMEFPDAEHLFIRSERSNVRQRLACPELKFMSNIQVIVEPRMLLPRFGTAVY